MIGNSTIADEYIYRAQNYKHLFNPANNFLQGRSNGGWYGPFRPEEVNFNYTEANGWQYSLAAPQDVNGLIDLMGDDESFLAHLDEMFSTSSETSGREQVDITGLIGQYAHGNEPSHHMAYLYSYAGQPWRTQELCRQIMDSLYWNAPDGLSGNEDCGQMSAWYVMSAMGFYPVCPGSTQYVIGTPRFEEIVLDSRNGKPFTIRAKGLDQGPYIQGITLNGKPYPSAYLEHEQILTGGELIFEMGSKPNKDWGSKKEDRPEQSIADDGFVIAPTIVAASRTFKDSLRITMNSPQDDAELYWSSDPDAVRIEEMHRYEAPFYLKESAEIYASTYRKDGSLLIGISRAEFFKVAGTRSIQVDSEYANQYAAGGDNALIDMISGGPEYTTGDWQGYREDLDVTVDLGEVQDIERVSLGCNQNIKSWIWFPKKVEIYMGNDPDDLRKVGVIVNDYPDDEYGALVKRFEKVFKGAEARYVRVTAEQYGTCPDWHLGAGGKTWIFVDELIIE